MTRRYRPSDWRADDAGWWLDDPPYLAHVRREGRRWSWSVDGPGVAECGTVARAMGARDAACGVLARCRAEEG